MLVPRPYQTDLIAAARAAFGQHRRVLLQAPTGAGKGAMIGLITDGTAQKGKRLQLEAHREEIVDQISRTLSDLGVRHGRIQPGHTMTDDPVQVGMIQTIARRKERLRKPDLRLVDECHHDLSGTLYDLWDDVRKIGFTATPQRLDGRGLKESYDTIILGPPVKDLIRAGYLAGYDLYAPPSDLDLSQVRTRMGEFSTSDLAVEMKRSTITGDAVRHYRQFLDGRPAIVFCIGIDHAQRTAQLFRDAGYRAQAIDGGTEKTVRRRAIESLGDGRLDLLMACDVISEGTDIPAVAGGILLRPTKSLSMFLQQIGRCLRVKLDGSRAVILDHVGNVHRHGMPDADRAWTLEGREKRAAAPGVRTCKTCYAVFAAGGPVECAGALGLDESCPLLQPVAVPRAQLATVDGELVRVSLDEQVFPAWADGISIVSAAGPEWRELVKKAKTVDQLKEIARVRGYKPGWVQQIMRQRNGWREAARA